MSLHDLPHVLAALFNARGHVASPFQRSRLDQGLRESNVDIRKTNMIANLPYTALRTFESVVRLRGFGRAAEELGVTQSAVSQHVKSLEEWLGRRLMNRGGGRAVPTDEGVRLAAAVAEGFGQVASLCHELRDDGAQNLTIGLSCLPGFAYNWLFPRLINFDQRHPEFPVSIITSASLTNFTDDEADLAIRYGLGGYAGLHVEPLLSERIFPVCSPALLERSPPLREVADLARHTLLVDDVADIGGSPRPGTTGRKRRGWRFRGRRAHDGSASRTWSFRRRSGVWGSHLGANRL